MLHTVNKSPFQNTSLESCLRFSQGGDDILLLEDAVYAAKVGTAKSALVEQAMSANKKVYAIRADIKARGIKNVMDGVEVVDYGVFVDLVEKNNVHSWL